MALELASGADFLCKLMRGAGPVDLRGSRGPGAAQTPKIGDFQSAKKSYIKHPGVGRSESGIVFKSGRFLDRKSSTFGGLNGPEPVPNPLTMGFGAV